MMNAVGIVQFNKDTDESNRVDYPGGYVNENDNDHHVHDLDGRL